MPKPNEALFDPLRTGTERPLQDHPMVLTETAEMERAIADFKAAIERGETCGPVDYGLTKKDDGYRIMPAVELQKMGSDM